MFGSSKLSFFRKQKFAYRNSNKRINLWDGSVRSGKTVNSVARWIKFIGTAPEFGDLIMTGKTNGTLYRNVIRLMEELLGDEMSYHQEHDTRAVELWGRKIFCFGANDERAENKIRGLTVCGGYGDEITLWPESYFNMHLSRMSVPGAKFFGTTNADNPRHYLKVNYINRKNDLNMSVFHFSIDDNTFLPPEFVSDLKREYVGLWYRRFIRGEWCVAEGAIYDFFDENLQVSSTLPHPCFHVAGVDYGTNNPFSAGLYGVNPHTVPKIWRIKGYWWDSEKEGRQKTDAEYSKDLKKFFGSISPRRIWVDPSAASFKTQLNRDGFVNVRDAKNDVLDGIRVQARMLQQGEYMLLAHPSNQECIDEYYSYLWDDKASKKGLDEPLKQDDHTKDEERYVLYNEFGMKQLDYAILTRS